MRRGSEVRICELNGNWLEDRKRGLAEEKRCGGQDMNAELVTAS
jgi:hypothetical protein